MTLAFAAQSFGLGYERFHRYARLFHQHCVAQRQLPVLNLSAHADAGSRFKALRLHELEALGTRGLHDGVGQGCSLPWSRLAARRSTSSFVKPGAATT